MTSRSANAERLQDVKQASVVMVTSGRPLSGIDAFARRLLTVRGNLDYATRLVEHERLRALAAQRRATQAR